MHRAPMTIIFIILAIDFLMDAYVFNGLKTLTKKWRSPQRQKTVRGPYLAVTLVITTLLLINIGRFRTAKGMIPYFEWILSLFLTLFLTKLFFCIILLLGDLGRGVAGIVNAVNKN